MKYIIEVEVPDGNDSNDEAIESACEQLASTLDYDMDQVWKIQLNYIDENEMLHEVRSWSRDQDEINKYQAEQNDLKYDEEED